jgi:hypothetical protein
MSIIKEEIRQTVLEATPLPKRYLLNKQIDVISNLIETNAIRYQYSKDFREGMDMVLNDILSGKYLGD